MLTLYQSYLYDSFGVKTGPTLRVTSWNQRNKDVEFICGENDSGERSRAIMALLSKELYYRHVKRMACLGKGNTLPLSKILDLPKLKLSLTIDYMWIKLLCPCKTNVFGGILESACLSVHVSGCVYVRLSTKY